MSQWEINITRPDKKKERQKEEEPDSWPCSVFKDEDAGIMTQFLFYDGGTEQQEDGSFTDTANWNNDDQLEELWTWSKSWAPGDGVPFTTLPIDAYYHVYGNASAQVRSSAIEATFAPENEKRWNRKPLGTQAKEWRSDKQQWSCGGTYQYLDPFTGETHIKSDFSFFNPKLELKVTKDAPPRAFVDPDSSIDRQSRKLRMKFESQVGEIRPLTYSAPFPMGLKFGIKVSDQTKSYAHYLPSTGEYVCEWIEDVYFFPFDTTDIDNVKITLEPKYDAGAVAPDGRIILTGKKWHIYLMPRRWFFFVRYMHQYNNSDILDWLQNGSGSTPTRDHFVCFFWGRWPSDFSPSFGLNKSYEELAEVSFYDSTNDFTDIVELVWCNSQATSRTHALATGTTQEESERIFFGSTTANPHVVWSDRDDFVRVSAYGSLLGPIDGIKHDQLWQPPWTYSDTGTYETRVEEPDSPNYGMKRIWKHIEESSAWVSIIKPLRDKVIHKRDEETESCGEDSPASRMQHIPFGVGISPIKEGDLLAVIRSGGKAYYLWAKQDQVEFDEKTIQFGGTPDPEVDLRGSLRFESNQPDGSLGHYSEQANPEHVGWLYVPHFYDCDYADQFSGPENGRQIDMFGRTLIFDGDGAYFPPHVPPAVPIGGQAVAEYDEGELLLDAPVWIMGSKERQFGDIYWGPERIMDFDGNGDPIYAPGNHLTDPSIDGRNGALCERAARAVFMVFEGWVDASYRGFPFWGNGL